MRSAAARSRTRTRCSCRPPPCGTRAHGAGHSFYRTDVAVYSGDEPGKAKPHADPYFGGEGPPRSSCIGCGGCMVGCRYNAKNTLDKNYLYFAEKRGARILAETRVVD